MSETTKKILDFVVKYRNFVLIAIGILVIGIFVYVFFSDTKLNAAPAIKSIPVNAAFIIETKNFDKIVDHLNNENEIWRNLSDIKCFSNLNYQLGFFDSLFKNNREIKNFIEEKGAIISSHLTGKDKFDLLFTLSLYFKSDDKKIKNHIENLVKDKGKISERIYDNSLIFDVKFIERTNQNINNFSFAFSEGVFFLSTSTLLVESTIRQKNTNINLLSYPDFAAISNAPASTAQARLYINYRQIARFLSNITKTDQKRNNHAVANFAGWSSYDFSFNLQPIQFNGYTLANDSASAFIKIFAKQIPQNNQIISVLPDKTAVFSAFSFDNFQSFYVDYKNYLRLNNELMKHNHEIDEIKKDTKIEFEKLVNKIIANEYALAYIDESRTSKNYETYFILKIKNFEEAEEELTNLIKAYKSQKHSQKTFMHTYKTGEFTFKVYEMPFDDFAFKIFGLQFANIPCDYYTCTRNYIIFGKSRKALENFLDSYSQKRFLTNDKDFSGYRSIISSKSNIFYYYNINLISGWFSAKLNEEVSKAFTNNLKNIKKIEALTMQFSAEKNIMNSNMNLFYKGTNQTAKPQIVWEKKFDTLIRYKPQIVTNPTTKEKEIIVQDAENVLYLLSSSGKILTKVNLNEKILSDVYQIDKYKNGKLQFLFNTATKIFLIDRNGKNVENFPIKLKAKATNQIAVFDYEKNRDYRIFIACADKQVYAYNKNGKTIEKWNSIKTADFVYMPLQYFNYEGKEYILFSDNINIYIVNRKGEKKIQLTANFPKSQRSKFFLEPKSEKARARFVTTSSSGEIHFIYLDGSIKKMVLRNFSANHVFEYIDINGDGLREFVFLDDNTLEVYNRESKKIFGYTFANEIIYEPRFIAFSKNEIKIGVVSSLSNQIFLFNNDGSIYKGFPLEGHTQFSISTFDKSSKFNIIVANNNKILYNYQLN